MRNKNFFGTLNGEAQSYWLGFFCADGGFHPNLKQFGFQLARKDRAHLLKLAAIFSREVKDGSTFDERTMRRYFWSKLTLHSTHMICKMMSYGLPLNKAIITLTNHIKIATLKAWNRPLFKKRLYSFPTRRTAGNGSFLAVGLMA